MNASQSSNLTVVMGYRDSLTKAAIKNVIVVVLGISINYINICLIQTFSKHQVFNTNPRYILFLHLVVNDMIQVSLTVFLFIISYTLYKINVSICGAFILLALFATENTPLNLACMAVECYIAICLPLHHAQICTVRRTKVLIGLIWMTSMLSVLPDLFIALAIEPPSFFKSRVFCVRETVFRNPHIIRKRDITYIVYLAVVWIVILYTYFKIIFTVKMAKNDARKARNTILLHGFQVMLCMATYAEPQLRLALHKAFPEHSNDFSFACYVVVYVLPRSISPVVYGIRDSTFRKYLRRHLLVTGMSLSDPASNLTTGVPRDSLTVALVKNLITVVLSISIIFINGMLIHTFRQHQVLNTNPRYILYIHLVANDIILLTMITLLLLISYTLLRVNTSICIFMVIVTVLAYLNNPFTLAAMALECYVAICFPLRHMQICTVNNTYVVIGLVWVISSLTILPDLFVILATESLDFFHSGVFCVRDKIFRSPELKEKRDISFMVLLVLVWLTLVYAYFNILCAARGATSDARKARNTVLLHGFQLSLCMLNYTYSHITSGLIALFPQAFTDILVITSILLQVLPRLVNPLIYGLRDKTFRKCVKRSLCGAGRDGTIQRKDEERPARGRAH
ncbi:uncharacterized protein ACB058_005151 [Synchiropus picturatus]